MGDKHTFLFVCVCVCMCARKGFHCEKPNCELVKRRFKDNRLTQCSADTFSRKHTP